MANTLLFAFLMKAPELFGQNEYPSYTLTSEIKMHWPFESGFDNFIN